MKKILVSLVVALISVGFENTGRAGEREGGGGTVVAAQFVRYGSFALNILKVVAPELDASQVASVIQETQVYDVSRICYSDPMTGELYCRDAEYDPNSRSIKFDKTIWSGKSCRERLVLAAHEYLRTPTIAIRTNF